MDVLNLVQKEEQSFYRKEGKRLLAACLPSFLLAREEKRDNFFCATFQSKDEKW